MTSLDQQTGKTSPWLWVALVVTILLTVWTVLQEETVDEASLVSQSMPRKATSRSTTADKVVAERSNGLIEWHQLAREPSSKPKDLFGKANWSPKRSMKKSVIKAAPPPPPQAPPVPFTYMGRLDDGPNGDVVYLADQEKSYSVGMGSMVSPFWRLDKEDEGSLYFTYLPLNLTQTLAKN